MGLVHSSRPASATRRAAGIGRALIAGFERLKSDLGVWADIRAFPPLAIWCGLNCVAALLVLGRTRATLVSRISAGQLDLLATSTAILAIVARALLARVESSGPARWLRVFAALACGIPPLTLVLAVNARQGLPSQGYVLLLTAIAGAAGAFWSRRFTDELLSAALSPRGRPSLRAWEGTDSVATTGDGSAGPRVLLESENNDQTTLWIERRTLPAGDELIQGAAAAEFAADQVVAAVHVCFCPPLNQTPELTFEARDADEVRVKAAGVYAWGCRFELKRIGDSVQPRRIEIRFRAVACRRLKAAA